MTLDKTSSTLNHPPAGDKIAVPAGVFFDEIRTGDRVFDEAIRYVFMHEGFYSFDSADAGGPTKYGISLRLARKLGDLDGDGWPDGDINHDGIVDIDDIRGMKPRDAVKIYKSGFWDRVPAYHALQPVIAIKAFDLAVNMGPRTAHMLLQRAVSANGKERLAQDGILGSQSIAVINTLFTPSLMAAYRSEAAGHYRLLAAKNPRAGKYLTGWLNRAYF